MCQRYRVNINFVNYEPCEEGTRLYQMVLEARQAYINFTGSAQTAQTLDEAYDKARTAYAHHLADTNK